MEYNFDLPRYLRASAPPERRDDVRLMVIDRKSGKFFHHAFREIIQYLYDEDVWINTAKRREDTIHPALKYRWEPIYAEHAYSEGFATAGAPFTQELLDKIEKLHKLVLQISKQHAGLSLAKLEAGERVAEYYAMLELPQQPGIAIGTTVLKALESYAAYNYHSNGYSYLYIKPGWEFKYTKGLLTNFHFPNEPQLVLTCAFAGTKFLMDAYEDAITRGYKFGDYGDRMLIL